MGSGPSAAGLAPLVVGKYPIIATNLSYRLTTPSDVLYAADAAFWRHYTGAGSHPGLKLSCSAHAVTHCRDVRLVSIVHATDMVFGPIGEIGAGGNSGFQALNLAVQFGAQRVLLAGLDFHGAHWHDDHKAGLRNPSERVMKSWAHMLDDQADRLRDWGVDILNLSRSSALKNYEKLELEPHGTEHHDHRRNQYMGTVD